MTLIIRARVLAAAAVTGLVLLGCGTTVPGTSPPTEAPADTPTVAPTVAPMDLDPSSSNAGVVARATLFDDTRGGRTGTHDIAGVAADASDCSSSFDGTEFTAVAWYDDAPDGTIRRFSVTAPADEVPADEGQTSDIAGRVSFDFTSESGVGTTYTGDASDDDSGQATIDVTRTDDRLVFDFEGVTWDDVRFAGQLVCATE